MDERTDWLQDAFRPLTEHGRDHAWADAGELRQRASRRRRRQAFALSGGTLVVVAALVVGFVGFGGNPSPPAPAPAAAGVHFVAGPGGSLQLVADTRSNSTVGTAATERALALDEERFALQLTRLELDGAAGQNVVLSPLSAHVDLAMLELGAAPPTAHEIAAALQTTGLSPTAQAAAWNGVVRNMLSGESAGEIHLANSLWVQRRLHVQSQFVRQAAATFGDDTYQVDFGAASAAQAINAWVAQQTAGRIRTLFPPNALSPATEIVLANALHFHAAWQQNLFEQATVSDEIFHTASGASVSVPAVVDDNDSLQYGVGSGYEAVQLPYSNGRFAALLVEPTSGTLGAFLSSLDPARLASITAALGTGDVDFAMPELRLSSLGSLNTFLSSLGMAGAFQSADFEPMLGRMGTMNQAVGLVQQAAVLTLNRWGTDAASATGVSVLPVDVQRSRATIHFDHPYLLLIRDTKTGAILFSTAVNDPAES